MCYPLPNNGLFIFSIHYIMKLFTPSNFRASLCWWEKCLNAIVRINGRERALQMDAGPVRQLGTGLCAGVLIIAGEKHTNFGV